MRLSPADSELHKFNILLTRLQQCRQLVPNRDRFSYTSKAIDGIQKERAGRGEHKVAHPPRSHSEIINGN